MRVFERLALASLVIVTVAGSGCTTTHPPMAHQRAGRTPAVPTPAKQAADRLAAEDAAMNAGPTHMQPASSAASNTAVARTAQFTPGMSLWGDLPGHANTPPTDASDNLQQVTYTTEGADFDVDVDPSGKWLVFASTRHQATADLYMKSIDGNTITKLTSDSANDVMPAVSPDGKAIAYASDRSGNWDIYIKLLDSAQPIQLTNSPSHELHPSWSPDGRQVIFSSLGLKSQQWEMVVVDVDNQANRKIIGAGLFPKFSPDGRKIVFQKPRHRGTRAFGIWTVDYIDGEGKRPTEIASAANAAVIHPTWSPDGERLAFATIVDPPLDPNARPQTANLWAVNLDGTGRVKLTNDAYVNLQPVWSRDGSILFISNRNGWDNVWALRPSNGTWTVVEQPMRRNPAQASVPTP